jgi:site-specific recombinase XerD
MLINKLYIKHGDISQFAAYLKSEERAPATIEKYIRDIRVFADFLGGSEITKDAAVRWKEYLKKTHEAVSVNSMVAAVNGFFAFLGLDIKVKPFKIQQRIFMPAEKELTPEDYEKLVRTAWEQNNERLCFVMQTICSTGIRVSELKFITVEAAKKGYAEIHNKGKIRTILIPTDLTKLLLRYAQKQGIKSGTIFITKNGKPLNRSNIWVEMKKLCKIAGVDEKKVFPHNLRRHFAVVFHSIVNDLSKLADVLGHANINTTRIYLKESGAEHRKIINSLGLVKYRLVT